MSEILSFRPEKRTAESHVGNVVLCRRLEILPPFDVVTVNLNCPFYGKWNPPSLEKPDNWIQAPVPDQVKRRLELQIAYAGHDDNPEAEHDRYAAVVGKRDIKPVAPSQVKPAEKLTLAGWPMNELQSADAQLGAINELAPVTSVLGGVMTVIKPEMMMPFFKSAQGMGAIGLTILLICVGWFFISKIIKIDV